MYKICFHLYCFFLKEDEYSRWRKEKECALGNREILFLAGQESRECCIFLSDVGICGIYLSLTLGTAKVEQQDWLCSLDYYYL